MNFIFFEGTQAGIIKIAPVIKEFEKRGVPFKFICSGQHGAFGVAARMIKIFGLPQPEYLHLSEKYVSSLKDAIEWAVRAGLKLLFKRPKNTIVITQGDSLTTLMGSLWAKFAGCKLAHIEAGMRSGDFFNPFPEELVRFFVDKIADYVFASSEAACRNVRGEKRIINMGANTLMDAMKLSLKIRHSSFEIPKEEYAVVTLHRYETIFNPKKLKKAIEIINFISSKTKTFFFMHESMRLILEKSGLECKAELRPFLEYPEFIHIVSNSEFVITDSGGLQEECYYLGKPCLLIREVTEHAEGLGKNVYLCGLSFSKAKHFLANINSFAAKPVELSENPSKIIADVLING